VDTGFIGTPIEWRPKEEDPWQTTHPDGDDLMQIMAKELKERMEACPGGGSRFGALSIVLGDMGFLWQMYTPPYIILLIRTFLTLEGIAGQVDPNFNIYEVALPWAVQRALSPSTSSARETLRSSLLTDGNTFQWERVEELIKQQQADEAEKKQEARSKAAKDGMPDTGPLPAAASSRARLMAQEANKAELDPALAAAGADAQAAQAATPLESFTTVLGSSNGATLRAIAKDVDSTEMLIKLASPAGRPMRRMAVQKLSETLTSSVKEGVRRVFKGKGPTAREFMSKFDGTVVPSRKAAKPKVNAPQAWPSSEKASRLAAIKSARANQAGLLLLRIHINRQVAAGWRGAAAVCALLYVTLRVGVAAIFRTLIHSVGLALTKLLPNKLAAATAAGAVAVIGWAGAELSALGESVTNTAEEIEMKKLQLLGKAEAKAKAKAAGATDEDGEDEAPATA